MSKGGLVDTDFSMDEVIRERNEMLTTLDTETFRIFMSKYNPGEADYETMPEHKILHSLHLARLQVDTIPESLKDESRAWLKERGLKTFEEGPA